MPVEWQLEQNNLAVFHITGKLGKAESETIQAEVEVVINKIGHISLLIILHDFTGWESAQGWEDTSFNDRNDKYIKKMAIVGEAKWHDMVTVFTLKGLRPVPIEYFSDNNETAARQWLASE